MAGGEDTWGSEWKVVNVSWDDDFALGSARAYAKLLRLHKRGLLRPLPVLAGPWQLALVPLPSTTGELVLMSVVSSQRVSRFALHPCSARGEVPAMSDGQLAKGGK